MDPLQPLIDQVSQTTTVEASAITLINGFADRLKAAGTDPAKLKALADSLTTSATALSAAVVANTPAATTPPTTGRRP